MFQKLTTLRTLEAKWRNLNIYHVWDPYLYTNDKAITQACQTLMAYTFVQEIPTCELSVKSRVPVKCSILKLLE